MFSVMSRSLFRLQGDSSSSHSLSPVRGLRRQTTLLQIGQEPTQTPSLRLPSTVALQHSLLIGTSYFTVAVPAVGIEPTWAAYETAARATERCRPVNKIETGNGSRTRCLLRMKQA
jgi:hypothetical protein